MTIEWVVGSVVHVPSVFPNESVTVLVPLGPDASVQIHSLLPSPVIASVNDLSKPLKWSVANLCEEELLLKDVIAFGVGVADFRCHFQAVETQFSLRSGALLIGDFVVAVPLDRLAPDLSVIVHFLDEIDFSLYLVGHFENLLEVLWFHNINLIKVLVRTVDIDFVLADVLRIGAAVLDLDIGPQVFDGLISLHLLVLVPVGPVILRVAEVPFAVGEHLAVAPELRDHEEPLEVNVGGVIGA